MTDQPPAAATGPMFQEIRTRPPDRTYPYRRLTGKTYAVLILVGLNGLCLLLFAIGLAMRWNVLSQLGAGEVLSPDLTQSVTLSDGLVGISAIFTLITL